MMKTAMTLGAAGVLLACLTLTACGPREDVRTARTDDRPAAAPGPATGAETASKPAEDASDASKQVAEDMKDSAKNAADQATNKVADAVITTTVNAEIAKDPALSASRIDVDTEGGRVALKGSAPDEAAKERAAQLAAAVKGVVSVDNQLSVAGKG